MRLLPRFAPEMVRSLGMMCVPPGMVFRKVIWIGVPFWPTMMPPRCRLFRPASSLVGLKPRSVVGPRDGQTPASWNWLMLMV